MTVYKKKWSIKGIIYLARVLCVRSSMSPRTIPNTTQHTTTAFEKPSSLFVSIVCQLTSRKVGILITFYPKRSVLWISITSTHLTLTYLTGHAPYASALQSSEKRTGAVEAELDDDDDRAGAPNRVLSIRKWVTLPAFDCPLSNDCRNPLFSKFNV